MKSSNVSRLCVMLAFVTLSHFSMAENSNGSDPDSKEQVLSDKNAKGLSVEWKSELCVVYNSTNSTATLKLFNLQGELLEYVKIQSSQQQLKIDLKPGTYYYSIRNSNGTHQEGSFQIKATPA